MDKSQKAINFSEEILDLIRTESDIEVSLNLAEWLAKFLWHNYCGLYRLDELEEILVHKFPQYLIGEVIHGDKEEIHVASEVYKGGGHTPLLCALIENLPSNPDVLLTRPTSTISAIEILKISSDRIIVIDKNHLKERVAEIYQVLIAYKKVVLHIHADDVPCAIALHLLKKNKPQIDISLVNHSDHSFSVALGIVDRVYEISAYGWNLRKIKKLESKSSFMGIPISPLKLISNSARDRSMAMSGGAPYKFKPTENKSLPKILDVVLSKNKNIKLMILGPKKVDWWWWPLVFKYRKNFKVKSHIARDSYLKCLSECYIYVDSFPVAGGTAFPEALISGAYILGMKSGVWGGSYADTLRVESLEDFVGKFDELLQENSKFKKNQDVARIKAIEFHAIETVIRKIEDSRNKNYLVDIPEELLKFNPEIFFESIWGNEKKVSFPRLPKKIHHHALLRVMVIYISYFSIFNANLFKSYIKFIKNKYF
jgi:hypothetical protein